MNDVLKINHNLTINSNMDDLALKIKSDIKEKYDVVVTEDNVQSTKKLMADINKEKAEFKTTYKNFKTEVLKPFTPLDSKAKEIETYYDEARTVLETQVKSFEEKKLEQSKLVCTAYATVMCKEKGIDIEAITISDLFLKLGSVTPQGNLSGTAKNEIDMRIQAVENATLKARIEAEEIAKREREIAEQARIEAEEKFKQREVELLAKAEIDKQKAVDAVIKEQSKPVEVFIEETAPIKEFVLFVTTTEMQFSMLSDFMIKNSIEYKEVK